MIEYVYLIGERQIPWQSLGLEKNDKKLFLNKIVLIITAIDRLYIIKDNKIVSEVRSAVSRLKTCSCISLVCDRVYITRDIIGLYKI